jgi:hypothetical protein
MITPELLKEFSTYKKQDLINLLTESGYTAEGIKYSKFRGVNRDGHFVYEITYRDIDFHNHDETGFLCVKFDHNLLTVTVDF